MPFHGRAAILVDESTTGAGERIAAFAQERKLAPVVGTRTAGRLICCSVYKVSQGYYVRIPARAWYTWSGELLEARGVVPDCTVTEGQGREADLQLERGSSAREDEVLHLPSVQLDQRSQELALLIGAAGVDRQP